MCTTCSADIDRRADKALCLLTLKRTHARLEFLIIGAEKWILSSNVHRCVQRVDKGANAEDVPEPNVHANKLCSAFGGAYTESNTGSHSPKDIADAYIEQRRNLKANLENALPQLHGVYFQHCNARQQITRTSKAELMKALSDYHLFPMSKGRDFQTRDDIKKALEQFFHD
ncbi:hypothetical protein ANCCEY_13586 [Ancylostoma ceylanicum]|uniref:Uncharacterized protein n=1 Tax=Ancylostoma ceylanicum TaxID=53326 RepID=A0A0D6LI94_9BILA|nr:hypothetical protein ANCCEY_13586 [Ancylostoma ceylanicum]